LVPRAVLAALGAPEVSGPVKVRLEPASPFLGLIIKARPRTSSDPRTGLTDPGCCPRTGWIINSFLVNFHQAWRISRFQSSFAYIRSTKKFEWCTMPQPFTDVGALTSASGILDARSKRWKTRIPLGRGLLVDVTPRERATGRSATLTCNYPISTERSDNIWSSIETTIYFNES
jgi:hypothetical protein